MATYYVWSGATGAANGTSWTDAYPDLDTVFTSEAILEDDVIRLADDHDNTSYVANKVWLLPEASGSIKKHVHVISTNRGTGLPSAGAIEQTGGDYSLELNGRWNCYGVTFKVGDGTSQINADIIFNNDAYSYGTSTFKACPFIINSSNGAASIIISPKSRPSVVDFNECSFDFLTISQYFVLQGGIVNFTNCELTGSAIQSVFRTSLYPAEVNMQGCDFSIATGMSFIGGGNQHLKLLCVNSKVPTHIMGTRSSDVGVTDAEYHSCTATDNTYFYAKFGSQGDIHHDVGVYLDGGATTVNSDGSIINYSLKMETVATAWASHVSEPLYSPWLYVPVFSTGSKTFEIKVANTFATTAKDNECWMELEYMGGGVPVNTPLTERETTAPVISGTLHQDFLAAGSSLADTAEAWTGIAGEKTHTLSKTVTVNEQGYARVRIALTATGEVLYVNPEIEVS